MTASTYPDPTKGPKVNVALVQLPAAKAGGKAAQVERMRELVREAAHGSPAPDIVVLGVSSPLA